MLENIAPGKIIRKFLLAIESMPMTLRLCALFFVAIPPWIHFFIAMRSDESSPFITGWSFFIYWSIYGLVPIMITLSLITRGEARSPDIVIAVAPTSATLPLGTSVSALKEIFVPDCGGGGNSSCLRPERKAKESFSDRVNNSGPSDQYNFAESPDHCRFWPASRVTFARGAPLDLGPTLISRPVPNIGVTYTLNRSANANHFPSGLTRYSVAFSLV